MINMPLTFGPKVKEPDTKEAEIPAFDPAGLARVDPEEAKAKPMTSGHR